jgi:hypothetical protein
MPTQGFPVFHSRGWRDQIHFGTVMSAEEFRDIERQLEETVSELRETRDWRLRRDMLATIRRLSTEAERLLLENNHRGKPVRPRPR